ncbi:uncharacterized protein LOC134690362 [Mytilus trossulus]|uniref:uncharacterized protein LOC134690362 n=1 Tax=Mytilus trossulus TaxID=6551 RepID=UPI0030053FEE
MMQSLSLSFLVLFSISAIHGASVRSKETLGLLRLLDDLKDYSRRDMINTKLKEERNTESRKMDDLLMDIFKKSSHCKNTGDSCNYDWQCCSNGDCETSNYDACYSGAACRCRGANISK